MRLLVNTTRSALGLILAFSIAFAVLTNFVIIHLQHYEEQFDITWDGRLEALERLQRERIKSLETKLKEAQKLVKTQEQQLQKLVDSMERTDLSNVDASSEDKLMEKLEKMEHELIKATREAKLITPGKRKGSNQINETSTVQRFMTELSQIQQDVYSAHFDELEQESNFQIREIMTTLADQKYMNPIKTKREPFCLEWGVDTDLWWQHHPGWYVSSQSDSDVTCGDKSFECYFLPVSRCDIIPNRTLGAVSSLEGASTLTSSEAAWMFEFLFRPRTWFRKAIFGHAKQLNMQESCIMLLRDSNDPQAPSLASFMAQTPGGIGSILLVTSSSDDISEARNTYPDRKWIAFELPFPIWGESMNVNTKSDDYLVILLSVLEASTKCNHMLHQNDELSESIAELIRLRHGNNIVSATIHRKDFH